MTNGDKHALAGNVLHLVGLGVFDPNAGDPKRVIFAEHLFQLMKPQRFNPWVFHQAVLQNFFCSQRIAAVYQGHFAGKFG